MVKNRPASQAGLRQNDIVIGMNGKAMTSIDDIFKVLTEWPVGQPLTVAVIRLNERKKFEVTPTEAK